MKRWMKPFASPLAPSYLLAVLWCAHVLAASTAIGFRAVTTSGIIESIEIDDVPMLKLLDVQYLKWFPWLAASGVGLFLLWGVWCWWRTRLKSPGTAQTSLHNPVGESSERGRLVVFVWLAAFLLFEIAVIAACWPVDRVSAKTSVSPIGWLDWTAVACMGICGWLMPGVLTIIERKPGDAVSIQTASSETESSWTMRNGMMYLLGGCAVFLYAFQDHLKFWDPERNGGYVYRQFFAEGEIAEANLVLYSTSVLFASVAAVGACLVVSLFRSAARQSVSPAGLSRRETLFAQPAGGALSLLSAAVWAAMFSLPWQIKLWPEIEAERGWILPAITLVFTTAALVPLIHLSWLMITADYRPEFARDGGSEPFVPRYSEIALWNFVLFPVYPWIRWVRITGRSVLYTVTTAAAGGAIWGLIRLANQAEKLYTFEDWRGMLKSGQFPFLRVAFALLAACFAYVVLRRVILVGFHVIGRKEAMRTAAMFARPVVLLLACASLALATWPFWGWDGVSRNVFARTAEYSRRHEFELKFLHWLFDLDRDGYAAVLHGADPDDFDPSVQPGHIPPPRDDNPMPIDEFEIADRSKARATPNVVIFFLEGVTRRSISAYGMRRLRNATPHMDSVARDGTVFQQARCFYPSTWDAWFSTVSGRFMRIQEFDMSRPFGDRYSRYNNLYKVLRLAGVNRWCHADCPPFFTMLVPGELRRDSKTAWMTNFDSSVSFHERDQGVWRGDKRSERILKFLDDLKPGDKFFICEHMSDTHFPWKRVPGLEWAANDAILPNGGTDLTYDHYYQTITRMDRQIGRVLNKLKEKGLYENTMVVIVSDHGCQWWEHEHMYYVSHLYDQCLLVPMIVRIPGLPGGNVVEEPVLQVDLLPTVMELAGIQYTDPAARTRYTCRSLMPLMKGTATPKQRAAYWERDVPLTTHYDKIGVISRFRYKLIFDRSVGTYKLFDLQEDPREMSNLADNDALLKKMLAKLRLQMRRHPAILGGIKKSENSPSN